MINEIWSKLKSEPDLNGYTMQIIDSPKPDIHTITTCRRLCRQNRCGSFNRNWGCPPGVGTKEECLGLIQQYSRAVLISHRFENVDFNDLKFIEDRAREHQDVVRKMTHLMRESGFDDLLPLSDGGCKYCGVCSYPDEACKFPEQMIPSISGFGVIMEEYLGSQGIDFKFEKDAFTLHGLILYRRCH